MPKYDIDLMSQTLIAQFDLKVQKVVFPANSRSCLNEDDLLKVELDVKNNTERNFFAIVHSVHKFKRGENRILKSVLGTFQLN